MKAKHWGGFVGDVETRWLTTTHPRIWYKPWTWLGNTHREMLILSTFQYIDPSGKTWTAPAGYWPDGRGRWPQYPESIINGASTGWFLRRLFPAFVGRYRRASVVHDVYCTTKARHSKEVHLMFYTAMRCDGTNPVVAWIMWLAVRVFGPRF